MKALFLKEVGGILMEVERKKIYRPTMTYYRAIYKPLEVQSKQTDITTYTKSQNKLEKWVCHSKGITPNDFYVFLLEGIE